jgi:hypothetical protein
MSARSARTARMPLLFQQLRNGPPGELRATMTARRTMSLRRQPRGPTVGIWPARSRLNAPAKCRAEGEAPSAPPLGGVARRDRFVCRCVLAVRAPSGRRGALWRGSGPHGGANERHRVAGGGHPALRGRGTRLADGLALAPHHPIARQAAKGLAWQVANVSRRRPPTISGGPFVVARGGGKQPSGSAASGCVSRRCGEGSENRPPVGPL